MKKQKGTECPLIVVDKGVFDSIVRLQVAMDRETDGRFFAEIMELPGVMSYGKSVEDAMFRVQALALRVIADRMDHGETGAFLNTIEFEKI